MNAPPGAVAFGTKAETLQRLAPLLTQSYVLPLVVFAVADWRADAAGVLARLHSELGPATLIVRSSALDEDGVEGSMAGAYETVFDVDGRDAAALRGAIDAVIAAYGDNTGKDQILVQHQLTAVRLSGVLLGRDLATLGPYRVFNYDDRSHRTDAVTSGRGDGLRTYVRFRGADLPYPNDDLKAAFSAFEEVESHLGDPIEAELAVDADGRVCLFQARPLAVRFAAPPADAAIAGHLETVARKVATLSGPHPYLHGSRSVFGVMPDWNPAEIIGVKPRALALSLYKELVTDSIWAYMRDNYGYRNLRSFPLLVSFLGVPFIDVRVSFNSFVPKRVREPLSQKLVNYYIDRLVESPHAHDKVEFDIVFSCYYPGITDRISKLGGYGFDGFEIGELLAELRVLTNDIMHPTRGYWSQDLAKIEELRVRQQRIVASEMSSIDKIYWLLEDCKRYGTLPFSGLARAGFIAVQYLRGLVDTGIIGEADYEAFLASLNTVTGHMSAAADQLGDDPAARDAFIERYGHLRPGTYDILSPRYDEAFERYFGAGKRDGAALRTITPFELRPEVERAIAQMMVSEGLDLTPSDLLAFMRAGIEGREYAKLVFTRSLSDAMVELEKLGAACGLSRDDLSHVDIRTVQRLYASLDAADLRDILLRDIEANRKSYEVTRVVRLPDLLITPEDVFHFHLGDSQPNFITLGKVSAGVVAEGDLNRTDLAGRIVFVRSADPGYDWIFTRRIGGLVTQFGGANSHMAIRAAEQGLPAIIGCGERNFSTWARANVLEIDCAAQTVRVLQ
jgi:phosphohistidine swiveling domain-containing protein